MTCSVVLCLQSRGSQVWPGFHWPLPISMLCSSPGHCSFLPRLRTRTWILQLSPKELWAEDLSMKDFERDLIDMSPQPLVYNSKIPKALKSEGFHLIHWGGGRSFPKPT